MKPRRDCLHVLISKASCPGQTLAARVVPAMFDQRCALGLCGALPHLPGVPVIAKQESLPQGTRCLGSHGQTACHCIQYILA